MGELRLVEKNVSDLVSSSMSVARKLGNFTWFRYLLLRLGIGGIARTIKAETGRRGLKLAVGWNHVTVSSPRAEITAHGDQLGKVALQLHGWENFLNLIEPDEDGIVRASTDDGLRRYRAWQGDTLLWHRAWPECQDTVSGYIARGAPGPGDVVFDLGAYVGEVTVALANLVGPTGQVVAFEPNPQSREVLQKNVTELGLTWVKILPYVIWKESARLDLKGANAISGSVVESYQEIRAEGNIVMAEAISMSEACSLAGVEPDFVKMDVEGAEVEILQGAKEWIRDRSIRFAVASYHERDIGRTAEWMEAFFRDIGYEVETGYSQHLTTWAWPPPPPRSFETPVIAEP
ncbi:MAG: hypothetical protein SynsKO_04560 [Synoicihabitans sp.]